MPRRSRVGAIGGRQRRRWLGWGQNCPVVAENPVYEASTFQGNVGLTETSKRGSVERRATICSLARAGSKVM